MIRFIRGPLQIMANMHQRSEHPPLHPEDEERHHRCDDCADENEDDAQNRGESACGVNGFIATHIDGVTEVS